MRARVQALEPGIGLALDWLLPQQQVIGRADLKLTNHMLYDATGFYLTGSVLGRQDAMATGRLFADTALARQWENGVLPENGGYDSSYQGVTLFRLMLFYLHVDPADTALRQHLWSAIERGIAWELTRVLPTGEIDTTGNSRVYPGGDKILGVEKSVAFVNTAMALHYYGIVAGDPAATATADTVITFYTTRR